MSGVAGGPVPKKHCGKSLDEMFSEMWYNNCMRARAFFALAFASFFFAGCIHEEIPLSETTDETQVTNQTEEETVVGELVIEDLVPGTGVEAKEGDLVRVHYIGKLTDGTTFDSSVHRGQPFEFTLGAGEVIKGWDVGVQGMNVGGKRKLTIPPQFAYGERGSGDRIPPNATLIFEIDLLAVNPEPTESS